MKLILVGSTGLVGSEVIKLALENSKITQVVSFTRSPLQIHTKLKNIIVDFENLPQDPHLWKADAVICTLGTTIKAAGSKEAFKKIDHDYVINVTKLSHQAGTQAFIYNSAKGADASSFIFYTKIKGMIEKSIIGMGFNSVVIVRPGIIGGARKEHRAAEEIIKSLTETFTFALPKAWQINPAHQIAKKMIEAALSPSPGVTFIESDQLS